MMGSSSDNGVPPEVSQLTLETLPNCPLCGSSERKEFYKHDSDMYLVEGGVPSTHEVEFWFCEGCGLIHQNPRWSPEGASYFYSDKYAQRTPPLESLEAKKNDSINVYDWVNESWKPPNKPKMLDVGTGFGVLPKTFKCAVNENHPKWSSYAVEPNKTAAEFTNNRMKIQTEHGEFSNSSWMGIQFDLITLHQVIEHIHDPGEMILLAGKKLRNSGRLFISCPSADLPWGPDWDRKNEIDNNFMASPHLYSFTPRTLARLLNDNGFFIERLDHYFRGMLCIARKSPNGERNELCGRDDVEILKKRLERARKLEREHKSILAEKERAEGAAKEGSKVLDIPNEVAPSRKKDSRMAVHPAGAAAS